MGIRGLVHGLLGSPSPLGLAQAKQVLGIPSSPARSQSCQNRTNPPTKSGSWRSFAPARQCFSGLSLSTCALGQTQRKGKRNACNTGSRKLGCCLEIRACQPLRLDYSKSFGPHRQETGKQFSEKLLSVCIPLIFLLHLRTPQIPSNRLSARTGASHYNQALG